MRLAKQVADVMQKFADRPAIGEREKVFVRDEATSRTVLDYHPRYRTTTYREFWDRAGIVAAGLHHDAGSALSAGEMVAILAFTSGDYAVLDLACIRLGAVTVPLQTGASLAEMAPIVEETEPALFAASVEYLETAVEFARRTPSIRRIVVLDHHPEVDDHREAVEAARERLAADGSAATLVSLADVAEAGSDLPEAPWPAEDAGGDPLSMLIYTSGSTGTPKGAMYTEGLASAMWGGSWAKIFSDEHAITIHYQPMSHVAGHSSLKNTLARGGTCYFTAKSNLSSLFEDLALVRPTEVSLVPRVCEMLYQRYNSDLARRMQDGGDEKALAAALLEEMRVGILGGRVGWASCSSAPLSAELRRFIESLLGIPLHNVYGSTEAGGIWVDNELLRPPVTDYRIVDVPELGYYRTDTPHPRGELLLKTESIIPGYYKRPDLAEDLFDAEGFYRTGDIVAEIGENRLVYVDRRKNVLKLSQGEFVATARLETAFAASPLVRQVFVYGKSEWSSLLAVVVPTAEALKRFHNSEGELKRLVSESFREIAKSEEFRPYEIPRDFLIESEPFSLANGLLSDHGKPLWPKLRGRYAERLDALYAELASREIEGLREMYRLRDSQSVIDTVRQAVRGIVGSPNIEIDPATHFRDLGGDSLSAVSLANVLEETFGVRIPIDTIISRGYDLQTLADYIEARRGSTNDRPTVASVHGVGAAEYYASQLTLDKFLDAGTLEGAASLPRPTGPVRTALLTGASGYLGRFLCLQLLEEVAKTDGKLICVVRGKDDRAAAERLASAFGDHDPALSAKYRRLADRHLEVLAGDIGDPKLGLDDATWQRLAEEVDLIVHAGALVNHIFPYGHLFDANVLGTAELLGLALERRMKPFVFMSSIAVAVPAEGRPALDEDSDIRTAMPHVGVDDGYASGYATSKWAGEVLLREAHETLGLPVTVFRSSMILAHRDYVGQLNVPDAFTRLLLSVVNTGLAPRSFYRTGPDGQAHRAHYDGLPVDFTAAALVALSLGETEGYRTFNLVNPHDDAVSLDTIVDWLDELGYGIERVDDYRAWFDRFRAAMEAMPERERQHSVLNLLHGYDHPQESVAGSLIPSDRFAAAVEATMAGPDGGTIPRLTAGFIGKYASDLQALDLIPPPSGGAVRDRSRTGEPVDAV